MPSLDLTASALVVAPTLLGAVLRHRTEEGSVAVRLTEVEAYLGVGEDPGSHAFRRMTPRTAPMFAEPGTLYAYFTYGMHTCLNIVCAPAGTASAVLLRGGEIVEGEDLASIRRRGCPRRDLARGPARLAQALGVGLDDSGRRLGDTFDLLAPSIPAPFATGPRTGVAGEGGSAEAYPWRFWIPGEPTVSPYRPAVRRRPPTTRVDAPPG